MIVLKHKGDTTANLRAEIVKREALIDRLNAECTASMDTIAMERERAERAEAEVVRLRAALKEARTVLGNARNDLVAAEELLDNAGFGRRAMDLQDTLQRMDDLNEQNINKT